MTYIFYIIKIIVMFLYSKKNIGILDSIAGYMVLQSMLELGCSTGVSCLIALIAFIPIVGFIFRRCIFLGTAKHIYFVAVAILTVIAILT